MKGPWIPYNQVFGGTCKYIAGRQIDKGEPLHGGNIEYDGEYTEDRAAVVARCEKLNGEASE